MSAAIIACLEPINLTTQNYENVMSRLRNQISLLENIHSKKKLRTN